MDKKNNNEIFLISMIIFVIIIVVILFYLLFTNSKNNENNESNKNKEITINPTLVDHKDIIKDDENIVENVENVEKVEKVEKFLSSTEEPKCTKQNCGAIDPVSDPSYNMKNVIKQTILLEEHLAEKNKYCIDCIIKHFLHCQGLLEEAIWLSCKNVEKYPYLSEGDVLYKELFDLWLKNQKNEEKIKYILEKLRAFRKKLVEKYYIEDNKLKL